MNRRAFIASILAAPLIVREVIRARMRGSYVDMVVYTSSLNDYEAWCNLSPRQVSFVVRIFADGYRMTL